MKVLQSVDAILCEDTRRMGLLWQNINENNPLTSQRNQKPRFLSYYEQNEQEKIPEIISALKSGLNVALVSDAGTPLISDPGFKLVRECAQNNIKVESIPGPSSVITALTISGLPTDKFLFLGFLPKKQGHRKTLFKNITMMIRIIRVTVIIFESPHRLIGTLEEMQEEFGDIEIVITRELTKIHEEVRREKVSGSLAHFKKTNPKGEFVILFNAKN